MWKDRRDGGCECINEPAVGKFELQAECAVWLLFEFLSAYCWISLLSFESEREKVELSFKRYARA